jgi:hypothetical protein
LRRAGLEEELERRILREEEAKCRKNRENMSPTSDQSAMPAGFAARTTLLIRWSRFQEWQLSRKREIERGEGPNRSAAGGQADVYTSRRAK